VQAGTQHGFRLGVGVGTASRETGRIRHCYEEAVASLQVGVALARGDPGAWAFEDLGVLHWIASLNPELLSSSRYFSSVKSLADHDSQHGTEFLRTLEAYLDHHGKLRECAHDLYVHRNTLRQRLVRITELLDVDLEYPPVWLNLTVAVKQWRLSHPSR
jgi:PucR family transcriptional regulator, purine catabolism regulatory protein